MFKAIIIVILFISMPFQLFSKAGSRIPKPIVSIEYALNLSKHTILEEKNAVDTNSFKLDEYIISSITYTKSFGDEEFLKWSWIVIFVHPVANDHMIIYRVFDENKIELIGVTE